MLFIGLPLFAILDDAERVSVLGHELAHGVNGDPTRGFVVGTAMISWPAGTGCRIPVASAAGSSKCAAR